jgi:hypothetical protein
MKTAVLALIIMICGCAAVVRSSKPALSTISVWNETGLAVDVYFHNQKLGTVINTRSCIKVQYLGAAPVGQLRFEVTSEQPFLTTMVDLRDSWSIRLGPSPYSRAWDALTLTRSDRCD